jgi:hypothetical protein
VSSLKNGGFSVVFHVPHEWIEHVGEFHELQGKGVRLALTLEDE